MKKLITFIKSLFKKETVIEVHDKLDNVLTGVGSTISMFTNTVNSLKLANDELSNIAQECQDVIQKHQGTLDNAVEQVKQNEQMIENIGKILGK